VYLSQGLSFAQDAISTTSPYCIPPNTNTQSAADAAYDREYAGWAYNVLTEDYIPQHNGSTGM